MFAATVWDLGPAAGTTRTVQVDGGKCYVFFLEFFRPAQISHPLLSSSLIFLNSAWATGTGHSKESALTWVASRDPHALATMNAHPEIAAVVCAAMECALRGAFPSSDNSPLLNPRNVTKCLVAHQDASAERVLSAHQISVLGRL